MPVSVNKISKRYGHKWALRDVSLQVQSAEVFGIFGLNGSGKSTLLRILAGKEKADTGEVEFESERSSFLTEVVDPESSFLSRVFGKKLKANLSGSEDKYVELKSAVEQSKGLLLLDEPFSGIDAENVTHLIKKIRESITDREKTVVISTSNFGDVFRICDRVAVLSKGEVVQLGTPQEVYDKPGSKMVGAITGRNNLFAARRLTSSKAEMPEFQSIDGSHRLFAQRIERGSLGAINQNVTLGIRPEFISMSFGASFPADNLLKAVISGIQFLGPTTLVDLDCGGLGLQALVLRLVGLNIGDECMVGLPPDRIQIFRN